MASYATNDDLSDLFCLNRPPVENLTDKLQLSNGRIYAIRFDQLPHQPSLKLPVIGGILSLFHSQGRLSPNTTVVDAGNINTGLSIAHFARKLGFNTFYIMSRYFPADMLELVRSRGVQVHPAPCKRGVKIEREFYSFLWELSQDREFRNNKAFLWHAKYGNFVMRALGKLHAFENVTFNKIVTSVGSGSTLNYLQSLNRHHNDNRADTIICEHENATLFANKGISVRLSKSLKSGKVINPEHYGYRLPSNSRIPNSILGPHYEEINPFLGNIADAIESVVVFNDNDWINFDSGIFDKDAVGNSSLANLSVAKEIAEEGNTVLTAILEPSREFYKHYLEKSA